MCDPPNSERDKSSSISRLSCPRVISPSSGDFSDESVSSRTVRLPPNSSDSSDTDSESGQFPYGRVSLIDPLNPVWIQRPTVFPSPSMTSNINSSISLRHGLSRSTVRPNQEVYYVNWEVIERLFLGIETVSHDLRKLREEHKRICVNLQTVNSLLLEVSMRNFQHSLDQFPNFLHHPSVDLKRIPNSINSPFQKDDPPSPEESMWSRIVPWVVIPLLLASLFVCFFEF